MISCQNLLTVSLTLIILNENYNGMGSFSKILLVTDRIDWLLTLIKTGLNQYVECSQNLLNTKNHMVQKNLTYILIILANIYFQYISKINVINVIGYPSYVGQIRNKFFMTMISVDIHWNLTENEAWKTSAHWL